MTPAEYIFTATAATGAVWCACVGALAVGIERLKRPSATTVDATVLSRDPSHGAGLPHPPSPSISVLIAARNEESGIARCLTALGGQDYPRDRWEVIMVDDNSSDRTAAIAHSFSDRLPGFKVIPAGDAPTGFAPKKWALTVGIWQAAGEVILTTDADCAPPPGWVSGMAGMFEEHTETRFASKPGHLGVEAVVGYSPLILHPPFIPPASGGGVKSQPASCLGHTLDAASGGGNSGTQELRNLGTFLRHSGTQALSRFDSFVNGVVAAGCVGLGKPVTAVGRNFAFRRAAWEKVGGYSAGASGDDDLLVQRIAAQGGKVVFASDPATFVPAQAPATFSQWWRMKRRHLSAGKRYQPGWMLLAATLYLFNFGLLVTAGLAIVGALEWWKLLLLWGVKATADGLALAKGAKLLREPARAWLPAWLVGELASPFVFTILVPAAMMGRIRWKGRKLDH